jgi:hypothetical protein
MAKHYSGLLCLRITSAACIVGAIGTAVLTAGAGTPISAMLLTAAMSQAAAYGINRLSAKADESEKELEQRAAELERGLHNADVQRLMGRAVAFVLELHAKEAGVNDGLRPTLRKLAEAVTGAWGNVDSGTLPPQLREENVSQYFNDAPEDVKSEPVLDADKWRDVLRPIAQAAETDLTDAEWESVGGVLARRYAQALYSVAKSAAVDNDAAWPGLLLRLLAEQRQVLEYTKQQATLVRDQADKNTERLRDVQNQITKLSTAYVSLGDSSLVKLTALLNAKDTRDHARYQKIFRLVQSESQRIRDGLVYILTAAGRVEDAVATLAIRFDEAMRKWQEIAVDAKTAAEKSTEAVTLLKGVAARVDLIATGQLSARSLPAGKSNLAEANVAPNRFFTGRTEDLAGLHTALASSDVAIVHTLIGEGGIGKTELAKVYALIFAHEYTGVWWVDASMASLRNSLAVVYRAATKEQAPPSASTAEIAQALIAYWDEAKHLVVLDNVEEPGAFALFGSVPTIRVLATTRELEKTFGSAKPFRLGVLERADSVALLRKEIQEHRHNVKDAELNAIAEEVGDHALALALAGAYLANYADVAAQDVLQRLKAGGVGDIEHDSDDASHDSLGISYRKNVRASLSLHFDRRDVKTAFPVLAVAAFLHPTGIPIKLLAAGVGITEDQARKACRTLAKVSIIKYDGVVSLHRLTQGVARTRVDIAGADRGVAALTRLIDVLIDLFKWPEAPANKLVDHVKTPERIAALPHAETLLTHADRLIEKHAQAPSRLRAELAHRLRDLGQLPDATRHIDTSIQWGEAQHPRDERSLADRYASRASIRQDRGDLQGAEQDIRKSIDWAEAQQPRDERSLADRYASRASIRQDRGDLQGAEQDIRKSIEWEEAQQPRDERSLAIRYASRAGIRKERGDLQGAEQDIRKSIDWAEAQQTRDERGLAICYASRASIRKDRGDLQGAEQDIRKSVDWAEAQQPRDERSLADRYALRAGIRQHRGDLQGAEQDIKKSIEWGEAQQPRDERSLAICYASRASIRQQRGDLQGAEQDIQKSIEWGEAQQPRDERSLAIWCASRASIRQQRGDLQGAEQDIQKSIEWGEAQQPRDERSLAIWYASRARIQEAQALLARGGGKPQEAQRLFTAASTDIAATLAWWEVNLPGDARSLAILRKVHARIARNAQQE